MRLVITMGFARSPVRGVPVGPHDLLTPSNNLVVRLIARHGLPARSCGREGLVHAALDRILQGHLKQSSCGSGSGLSGSGASAVVIGQSPDHSGVTDLVARCRACGLYEVGGSAMGSQLA